MNADLKKLNICLLNDSFPPVVDGVANAVVNYAEVIQNKLGNSMVVTPDYPGAEDNYDYPVVRFKSYNTEKLVGYRTGNPLSSKAISAVTEFEPDILHLHCPFASAYVARMLRELTNAPIIYTYHTKFDVDLHKAIKIKGLRQSAIKGIVSNISACDDVWVVSKGAGENLRSLGYEGDYTIMENGVDFPRGSASADEIEKINEKYSLSYDIPVFLFTGRMMWYKGIDKIIDALKELKQIGFAFKMLFVGSGLEEHDIKKSTHKHGLENECIFTGSITDRSLLRAYFSRADLFLFPSTFDTNGIVVREAAACETASVLIKGSCAAEGVEDKVNGLLIHDDAHDLFLCLKYVCSHLEETRALGTAAMDQLYLSWEDSVQRAYERYFYIYEKYTGMRKNSSVKHSKMALTMAEMLENRDKNKQK